MTPLLRDSRPIERILIRVNNWIGDVVMISPAMRAIRKRFPRAEITLLAKTGVLEALEGSPYFDRMIEYDREDEHAGLLGRGRLILRLRGIRFDLAILFQKAFEAAAFARAAGIPIRIGFRSDHRGWLLSHSLDVPSGRHHVEQFLCIAESLGCDISDRRLSFHLDQKSRDAAWSFLVRTGVASSPLRVAFHPGASKPPRGWHPERLAEVAKSLVRSRGARPLLLGSERDLSTLEAMARLVGAAAVLPPRRQSLREMAAVLERCHLLVCNDSGPMHVAAALRIPVVAVFGPGHPERTSPYADPTLYRVVTAGYPCSPCRQDFFSECIPAPSGKPYCLEDVPVRAVGEACEQLLDSLPGAVKD